MLKDPKFILNKYWSFDSFKGSQKEIINAVLDQRDVLALLPTGGGKSLCFQVPALVREGICIVVSPLVALIHDQVENLKEKGIKAIALTGGISYEEMNNLLDNCLYGNYKFLYLSPERLQQEIVRDRIQQMNVNLIAIDEAHCISQWGHDFRPAYLECSTLSDIIPNVPVIALTATATHQVAKDIINNLKIVNPLVVKDSFSRDNIAFTVLKTDDKRYHLKQLCKKAKGSAIIYVRTRRMAQDLANFLNQNKCSATFFHGGLSKELKQDRLSKWLGNQVKTMVATNAFGMGIDKPDVSLVVHYQIPDCIENYYQEAGRAGRNGEPAQAILLTNKMDEQTVKNQFLSILPDIPFIKTVYNKLNNYFQIAYGEGSNEKFNLNFNLFCETYKLNPLITYNVFRILDQNSVFSLTEAFYKKSTLRFTTNKEQLMTYLNTNRNYTPIIQTILRTYGGIFEFDTKINTHLIAKKAGVKEPVILSLLKEMATQEVIAYEEQHNDLELTFLVPREDDITINMFSNKVKKLNELKITNTQRMLSYVNDSKTCRNMQLLRYFGEKLAQNCGICDVCISKTSENPKVIDLIINEIKTALKANNLSSRQIAETLPYKESSILIAIQNMLESGIIRINTKNEYEL